MIIPSPLRVGGSCEYEERSAIGYDTLWPKGEYHGWACSNQMSPARADFSPTGSKGRNQRESFLLVWNKAQGCAVQGEE